MPDANGDELMRLLDQSQALSAQIGRLRSTGGSAEALIAQHREVSGRLDQLRAAQEVAGAISPKGKGEPQITVVTSEPEFRALRDEWDELLDDSCAQTPFLTWEWLFSWWEIFGAGKELRVILVREADGGPLIGLAPMMLGLRERGRLRRRVLAFIGTGEAAEGDYFSLVARRGREGEALKALWVGILGQESDYDRIVLCDVCTGDPALLDLIARAARDGRSALVETRRQSVLGPLPRSFDEFIASVPDKQRRNYLRDMGRHLRSQQVTVEHVAAGTEAEIEETLQAVARFSIARQRAKGRQSVWCDPAFAELMRRACLRLRGRDGVQADVLRQDGRILAALLGFRHKDTYFCYQMGFDVGAAALSPLHHLIGQRMRQCVEDGYAAFDFLAGEHEYKTQYFVDRKAVGTVTLWNTGNRSAGGQVAARLLGQEVRQRLKSWIMRSHHKAAHAESHG